MKAVRIASLAALLTAVGTFAVTMFDQPAWAQGCIGGVEQDFNGDGLRDDVGSGWRGGHGEPGGSLALRYGGTTETLYVSQATPGIPGADEDGDGFGAQWATYDRNKDGCSDLVVSAPNEALGSLERAGNVWVIPGSPSGLDYGATIEYSQDSPGFPGVAEADDNFGAALAAGTTSTGRPYLVIGSPSEMLAGVFGGNGMIHYVSPGKVYGIHQDTPGVAGRAEEMTDESFGQTIAASGDYFAVGSPDEAVGDENQAGMMHVFSHKLGTYGPEPLASAHQDSPGVSGTAEFGDFFADTLDVVSYRPSGSGTPGALVAVGVSWEDLRNNTVEEAGQVQLFYVSPTGAIREVDTIHQDTPDVYGGPERSDRFGDVVALSVRGDNPIGTPQTTVLAVYVPFESLTSEGNEDGAISAFQMVGEPGDHDVWVTSENSGANLYHAHTWRSDSQRLYVGSGSPVYGIPWTNIFDGASEPVTVFT